MFGQTGGDLAAEAPIARRLVDDNAAAGARHRSQDGVEIQGGQGGDVDHLGRNPTGRQGVGGSQGILQGGAPGHQGDIVARPHHEAGIERQRHPIILDLFANRAIQPAGFEEHHRIGVADSGQQQAIGPLRRGRDHRPEAGNLGEHRLGTFGMMLGGMNARPHRRPHHQRAGQPATGAIPKPRGVVHQLVEHGIEETHELNFGHRPEALGRQPDGYPADRRLGQGGVHHPLWAEASEQAMAEWGRLGGVS